MSDLPLDFTFAKAPSLSQRRQNHNSDPAPHQQGGTFRSIYHLTSPANGKSAQFEPMAEPTSTLQRGDGSDRIATSRASMSGIFQPAPVSKSSPSQTHALRDLYSGTPNSARGGESGNQAPIQKRRQSESLHDRWLKRKRTSNPLNDATMATFNIEPISLMLGTTNLPPTPAISLREKSLPSSQKLPSSSHFTNDYSDPLPSEPEVILENSEPAYPQDSAASKPSSHATSSSRENSVPRANLAAEPTTVPEGDKTLVDIAAPIMNQHNPTRSRTQMILESMEDIEQENTRLVSALVIWSDNQLRFQTFS